MKKASTEEKLLAIRDSLCITSKQLKRIAEDETRVGSMERFAVYDTLAKISSLKTSLALCAYMFQPEEENAQEA